MINISNIRNVIVAGLYNHINRPVILFNQNSPKPKKEDKKTIDYPFIAYKFTTLYIPEEGESIEIKDNVLSDDPTYEYDVEYTRLEQPTMTLSITAYSKEADQASETALNALEWFEFNGYEYLKKNGLIVVNTTSLQNRDTLIVDDYERRIGFDVVLRTTSEVKRTVETIETADIQKGE